MVETKLSVQFMTPPDPEIVEKIEEAKLLIAEAGLDFDELYPVAERPTAVGAAYVEYAEEVATAG